MVVMGPVIIVGFAAYEVLVAKYPVIPRHMLRNKAVMAASLIGFFDFVRFLFVCLSQVYLTPFVMFP